MSIASASKRAWRRWADEPRLRWKLYVILVLIVAILVFFPRPWTARAKIVPQDTSSSAASTTTLLANLGGAAQNLGSLLTGGRPSNDLYLIIGRSDSVTNDVIASLRLAGPNAPYRTARDAKLALAKKVDVHLLLGGVLEIEAKTPNAAESLRITGAYQDAISRQLARFGKQIVVNKQRILNRRFNDAGGRVARAEAELNAFRRANNLADPDQQLGAALSQRATLDAQIKAKTIELQTESQFRGPESLELAALRSDIAGLRAQLARTVEATTTAAGPNVAGLSDILTRYFDLYRNYRFTQSLYDVYERSAEQVAVEALAAESASYIQIIDPAHLDPERQINTRALGVLGLIILAAIFTEWYGPATGLFTRRGLRFRYSADHEAP